MPRFCALRCIIPCRCYASQPYVMVAAHKMSRKHRPGKQTEILQVKDVHWKVMFAAHVVVAKVGSNAPLGKYEIYNPQSSLRHIACKAEG